jgi:hypothetical protein
MKSLGALLGLRVIYDVCKSSLGCCGVVAESLDSLHSSSCCSDAPKLVEWYFVSSGTGEHSLGVAFLDRLRDLALREELLVDGEHLVITSAG